MKWSRKIATEIELSEPYQRRVLESTLGVASEYSNVQRAVMSGPFHLLRTRRSNF
ncbi:MAG: hypothetical protein UT41_C0001G0423 [Candidatus Wolfebacteria bacterium GW2011_GWC2_39_22]|uniref:Uncharacterized protein n=1 Tax=Candidatus Wolfebacteria bacterium GW2011_GWC2_39_22 TaxID=1619013 RepID=A0A0G0N9M0_9BACT|nr:MAG: hypothetical protein UT41_C0001G0423 [Candidatus Wolfebacteria bacterium GW2011_GWC2_39_22]